MDEAAALFIVHRLCSLDAPAAFGRSAAASELLETLQGHGLSDQELQARYLYLQCVQDQGGEIEGVRLYVERGVRQLLDAGIDVLNRPLDFFSNISTAIGVITSVHEQTRLERRHVLSNGVWSLFDQTRPIPSILFRWGSPLAVLASLEADGSGLLEWVGSWRFAGEMVDGVPRLKGDSRYGLGKAIGDKASWLFMKLVLHTYGLLQRPEERWGPLSYQIPIDQNVGRVLMRSGILFPYITPERFDAELCEKQSGGRKNLSANRLRVARPILPDGVAEAAGLALRQRLQHSSVRTVNIPWLINGMLDVVHDTGVDASVGRLDDAILHVGLTYCRNDNPDCDHCPLSDLCYAHNEDRRWIDDYYCGTGTGVFLGM